MLQNPLHFQYVCQLSAQNMRWKTFLFQRKENNGFAQQSFGIFDADFSDETAVVDAWPKMLHARTNFQNSPP